jgi:hypothetical protein
MQQLGSFAFQGYFGTTGPQNWWARARAILARGPPCFCTIHPIQIIYQREGAGAIRSRDKRGGSAILGNLVLDRCKTAFAENQLAAISPQR